MTHTFWILHPVWLAQWRKCALHRCWKHFKGNASQDVSHSCYWRCGYSLHIKHPRAQDNSTDPLHNLHCSRYPAPPSLLLPPQLIHLSLSLACVTHRVSVAMETNDALSALVLMQTGCWRHRWAVGGITMFCTTAGSQLADILYCKDAVFVSRTSLCLSHSALWGCEGLKYIRQPYESFHVGIKKIVL